MREPERERLSLILNELGTGRGRARQGPQRGHPARQPGAGGDRQGARDPRAPEHPARAARGQLGHRARPAGARPRAGGERDPQHRARSPRRRPRSATALEDDIQTLPRFLDELEPTMVRLGVAGGRDHAGAGRPARPRRRHQQRRPPPRAVLAGRDPRRRLARRGGQDRHARGHRRAARDRRPARPGEGRAAGRRDAARGARVLPRHRRHRARDGLHLLPSGRDQRLRRGRPLPARRPDRQPVRDLRAGAGRRAARRSSRSRDASASSARRPRPPTRSTPTGDDPVLRATAIALARALGQEIEKAKQEQKAAKQDTTARSSPRPSPSAARQGQPRTSRWSRSRRSLPAHRPAAAPRVRPTAAPAAPPRRGRRADGRRPRPPRRDADADAADPSDALLDYLFGKDGG